MKTFLFWGAQVKNGRLVFSRTLSMCHESSNMRSLVYKSILFFIGLNLVHEETLHLLKFKFVFPPFLLIGPTQRLMHYGLFRL